MPDVKRNFRICLLGASLDVGNMGVRALGVSLVQLVQSTRPQARIQFLYGNRSGGTRNVDVNGETVTVEVVNCRLSPKAPLKEHLMWIFLMIVLYRIVPLKPIRSKICRATPWLRALAEADLVGDIRGGDSFSDIYGLRRFFADCLPAMSVLLLGKQLVILPQTIGPFKSSVSKFLAREIIKRTRRVYCRAKEYI